MQQQWLNEVNQTAKLVKPNLLPSKIASMTYTLVLDLDETLIHYDHVLNQFKIRPFCRPFLLKMSSIFELVIFTAAQKDYADFIIDQLDPLKEMIQFRLYRQHCEFKKDGNCVKDLAKLGRSLQKTIIVDNLKENFERQPRNGIWISTWESDPFDTDLNTLGE